MNISNQLKSYGFSYFETLLWEEAKGMVDERLKGNRRRGATFEAFIYLIFDFVVDTLNLKNKIRVLHNPFTYRKYVSRQGLGIDILVTYKKWTGNWIQLFAIECKDWQPRFMSPKVFLSHVQKRFWNIVKPLKILITRGIEYSVNTLTKIKNYGYTQITNNYVDNIKQLIITNIPKSTINNIPKPTNNNNNMIKSVHIHMTRNYPYCKDPIPNFNTLTATENNNILYGG